MMEMMGGMAIAVLVGLLALAVGVGVAVYLGVRAVQRSTSGLPSAQETLQHRLAAGELTVDEYHEREAALRAAGTATARRR